MAQEKQVPTPARKRVRRGNQEDAEQLRQELLQAAVELVAEQGTHALTVRAVALRVGVSAMTPYRYFADKTELLEGVWRQAMQDLGEQVTVALAGAEGGRTRLRIATDTFLCYWQEHPDYYSLLFGFDRIGRQHNEPLRVRNSTVFARLLEIQRSITEDVAREIGAGMDHAKLASDVRYAMQLGFLHGTMVIDRYAWSDLPTLRATYIEQIAQAVEHCLLHGPAAMPDATPAGPATPRRRAGDTAPQAPLPPHGGRLGRQSKR